MRLNEGVIDGYNLDVSMLYAVRKISMSFVIASMGEKAMAGHIRIAEHDPTNSTEAVDSNKCFRHDYVQWSGSEDL